MKPYVHARLSAKKYGGVAEDYLDIHDFFDQTKMALPDIRHRLILHNSVGCYIAEQVFGHTRTNSEGKVYHVRNVAEDHIIEDMGFIPTLERCLEGLKPQPWMSGGVKRHAKESEPFQATYETWVPLTAGNAVVGATIRWVDKSDPDGGVAWSAKYEPIISRTTSEFVFAVDKKGGVPGGYYLDRFEMKVETPTLTKTINAD